MKKDKTKQSWAIPITAILIAIIVGGSIFASQYYRVKSDEKQQQAEREANTKLQEDKLRIEACMEQEKLRAGRTNVIYIPQDCK